MYALDWLRDWWTEVVLGAWRRVFPQTRAVVRDRPTLVFNLVALAVGEADAPRPFEVVLTPENILDYSCRWHTAPSLAQLRNHAMDAWELFSRKLRRIGDGGVVWIHGGRRVTLTRRSERAVCIAVCDGPR